MTTPAEVRALYVHVPFCRARCGYCDFYSELYRADAVQPLLNALSTDWRGTRRKWNWLWRQFLSVADANGAACGSAAAVAAHLHQGRSWPAVQFTVEANPATIDAGRPQCSSPPA